MGATRSTVSVGFLTSQLTRARRWLYFTWFNFAVLYRKTFLGPLWIIVGPSLFIVTLGLLFSQVNNTAPSLFIPHLAIGLVTWTLISGFVINSSTVFQRNKAQIMQGNMSLVDITMIEVLSTILQFVHQLIIIIVVFAVLGLIPSLYSLVSLLGLALLILNGVWLTVFFGIIGARYRDLPEIIIAIMRIAFLATPIIWMPGASGRGEVVGAFLNFNPFHHFLELIRAPLLGQSISMLSVLVVLTITLLGSALAYRFYKKFAKLIPLWV